MPNIKRYIYRRLTGLYHKLFGKKQLHYSITYSQSGEDRILAFLFNELKISKPTYIDVGAHHPTKLSNTHLFYLNGSRGVNIEPDPELFKAFGSSRPQDININAGIGITATGLTDFYIMSNRFLNTFSKEEAERVSAFSGIEIEAVRQIDTIPLQVVVDQYFGNRKKPDLISIDVEGLDFDIVKSIDLNQYRETVFCVETIAFVKDAPAKKQSNIISYFAEHGFFVYGDTYINSIFVNEDFWISKRSGN